MTLRITNLSIRNISDVLRDGNFALFGDQVTPPPCFSNCQDEPKVLLRPRFGFCDWPFTSRIPQHQIAFVIV